MARFADLDTQELYCLQRALDMAHHKAVKVRHEQPGATLAEKDDNTSIYQPLVVEVDAEIAQREQAAVQ